MNWKERMRLILALIFLVFAFWFLILSCSGKQYSVRIPIDDYKTFQSITSPEGKMKYLINYKRRLII